jgi:hypothetical protein
MPGPISREGALPKLRPEIASKVAAPKAAPHTEEGPSPFARILKGLGNEVERGERLVGAAMHGGHDMGAQDLLVLQAGVYRYSEAVDLSAKLVDRAATGVKTVIQGQ